MAKNKLMLNNEWSELFCGLPDEQAGKLIKALFGCHAGEATPPDDPVLAAIYNMMAVVVEQNREAYNAKCEQMKSNGRHGGRPKTKSPEEKPDETKSFSEKPDETKRKQKKPIEKKGIEKNRKESNKDILSGGVPLMVAVKRIVDHLNEKAGTKYMASSRATVELIKARMGERWTVEDHIKVIDNMVAKWKGDPKMEDFLRPSTLFARCHFEEYLNSKPAEKKLANKFANFPQREDDAHKSMVQQIIAMQT